MPDAAPVAYRTRLWVLFARAAPRAVILRRGPKNHFRLIAWDLRKDRFEPGQWMKGQVRLCDLSPDGEKLLYWAHQYHASAHWRRQTSFVAERYEPLTQRIPRRSPRKGEQRRRTPRYLRQDGVGALRPTRANEGVWTALSRPPFFTALALWPGMGHWTGGGWFLSDGAVAIGEREDGLTPKLYAPPPREFRILPAQTVLDQVPSPRVGEDWTEEARRRELPQILAGLRAEGARWIEFVSPRPDGGLLFGVDGVIHRLRRWRQTPADRRLAQSTPLLDLRPMRFQRVAPPEQAMRWR